MCCFHRRSYIASVIHTLLVISKVSSFGMGIVVYRVNWSFGLFQGEIFVIMSFYYHVDMFHTHFQSFKHCRTSATAFVTKCVFCVSIGRSHCKVVALRKVCCSYVLSVFFQVVKWSKYVIMLILSLFLIFISLMQHLVKLEEHPDLATQPYCAQHELATWNLYLPVLRIV